MKPPLKHPATWSGGELTRQKIPADDFVSSDIRKIQDQLEHGPGLVLLRGFPVEACLKSDARESFKEWCSTLGTLLSQNEKGETVFDVTDAGFGKDDPRTRGPNTNKKLSFHTDRCDVIAFLCWKQAKSGGENEIISSMHLYNEIARRPDLLEVLMQSFPYKRHTVDLGNDRPYCEQPIFSFRDGHFACSFLRVLINRAHGDPDLPNLTPIQIEAMDFLEAVADEPDMAFYLHQKPGDVLLLNNWVTLHRRSAFEDYEDRAEKRCLFRAWLSMPNNRPLDLRFKENFGATEAGEIRGGFKTA
jgi:hypothetical protein